MKKSSQHLVMIVGMHRSGTSAVGQVLDKLGFAFGNNLLEGIQSINDEGFWEDKEVVALNQHILELLDTNWFDFERLPGKWWEDARIKELVGIAETWFYENFTGEGYVAIKDPRFSRLLPFWKRVFQGLKVPTTVLFVYRHPIEVAASLKRRDGFSLQVGYLLWLTYVIDGLYYSRTENLVLLNYADLIKDPKKLINRLAAIEFKKFEINLEPEKFLSAIEIPKVDKQNQRQEDAAEKECDNGDIKELADELYGELVAGTAEDAKELADKYRKRLYRLLDHYKDILAALRDGINQQVETNKKLSELGVSHSHALEVIGEKDSQLEENKQFIENCLEEIRIKNQLFQQHQEGAVINDLSAADKSGNQLGVLVAEFSRLSEDYRSTIAEQKNRLLECEAKISDQLEGLAENQTYIARCQSRIAEQDIGIAENKGYIVACEQRIQVQDEGLTQRDKTLEQKNERIVELDKITASLQFEVTQLQMEWEQCRRLLAEQEQKSAEKDRSLADHLLQIQAISDYIKTCEARIVEQDLGISENKGYIVACEERIRAQDDALSQKDSLLEDKHSELSNSLKNLQENTDYISRCESRISEQDSVLEEKERFLQEYLQKINENANYIAKCEARIVEQDIGLGENRGYIAKSEARIAEQDKILAGQIDILASVREELGQKFAMLSEKEQLLMQKNEELNILSQKDTSSQGEIKKLSQDIQYLRQKISELDESLVEKNKKLHELQAELERVTQLEQLGKQRLALQKKQLEGLKAHCAAVESELAALNAQDEAKRKKIERYRSYRVVRAIDRFLETE